MSQYDEFFSRFRVKNVQVVRDRGYQTIDYGYNKSASYYTADREELVEMEITRSGFEALIDLDKQHQNVFDRQREEYWLRKEFPALKEAYDKYQTLLALYK